jgi:hypothetical protein
MMTTYTPGPWRLFTAFTDPEIVTDRKSAHETESLVQFRGQPNALANARLMAAAPELLEALELAETAVEYYHDHEGAGITLKAVRDAIAKATGGQR